MARIFTVTPNPSVDYILDVPGFHVGGVLRAQSQRHWAAGKGIIAARTVAALDHDVVATALVGRDARPFFAKLEGPRLKLHLIDVLGKTRENVTLRDPELGTSTHIQTDGFTAGSAELELVREHLESVVQSGDVVALGGQLPLGWPLDAYAYLARAVHCRGALVILDASGAALRRGLAARPFVAKPNLAELGELQDRTLTGGGAEIEVIKACVELAHAVDFPVVSRGTDGIIAFDARERSLWRARHPLQSLNASSRTVGAGDALAAGLAIGICGAWPIPETLRYAVACATASVSAAYPGDISADLVRVFAKEVHLERIQPHE